MDSGSRFSLIELIRKLLPVTSIALLIALGYAGWTLMWRWQSNRDIERSSAAKEAEKSRKFMETYGSEGELKILMFYSSPQVLQRGQKGLLCYGVSNAKSVRVEPEVEPLTPALSRCVEIAPTRQTSYKLIAEGAKGGTAVQSVVVKVD